MGAWYVPKGLKAHFLVPATPVSSSLVGAAHCRRGPSSAGFLPAGTLGRHDSHCRLLGVFGLKRCLWVVVIRNATGAMAMTLARSGQCVAEP